jgi:hypothetical protein
MSATMGRRSGKMESRSSCFAGSRSLSSLIFGLGPNFLNLGTIKCSRFGNKGRLLPRCPKENSLDVFKESVALRPGVRLSIFIHRFDKESVVHFQRFGIDLRGVGKRMACFEPLKGLIKVVFVPLI